MQHTIERELNLSNLSVRLATVVWDGVEETPPYPGYNLSQRLSEKHPPLRIGNFPAPAVLPRVRSVGLLPPGRSIRLLPVDQPLRVIYCSFDRDYFERATGVPGDQWLEHTEALVSMRNKRLEIMMQEIYAELVQPGFGSETLIEAVGSLMVVELARYLRQLARRRSQRGEGLALAPWQLQRIQARIAAGIEEGYPNLVELAQLCGISRGHLARSFKAATGWQIHKYIADERLRAARDLLGDDRLTCEEVARRLGFSSAAYFSTVFRRATGRTPTEYRRQFQAPAVASSRRRKSR